MLGLKKNAGLIYFCIDKKIDPWVFANQFIVLGNVLAENRVDRIGIEACKKLKMKPSLEVECLIKDECGKGECVSSYQFRDC